MRYKSELELLVAPLYIVHQPTKLERLRKEQEMKFLSRDGTRAILFVLGVATIVFPAICDGSSAAQLSHLVRLEAFPSAAPVPPPQKESSLNKSAAIPKRKTSDSTTPVVPPLSKSKRSKRRRVCVCRKLWRRNGWVRRCHCRRRRGREPRLVWCDCRQKYVKDGTDCYPCPVPEPSSSPLPTPDDRVECVCEYGDKVEEKPKQTEEECLAVPGCHPRIEASLVRPPMNWCGCRRRYNISRRNCCRCQCNRCLGRGRRRRRRRWRFCRKLCRRRC